MSFTINSGFRGTTGLDILPPDSTTWADLGSSPYGTWDTWTTWHPTPTYVEVVLVDDLQTIGKRIPELELIALGEATITLDISNTGTFTGEETTINFVEGTSVNYASGRYYRWTIRIDIDSFNLIPTHWFSFTDYDTTPTIETLEDFDVPSAGTDSSGYTLVPNNLGLITNVQATTLQGDPYMVDDYVAPDYTMTQLGGVAVIQSKEPLAIQVVDYTGAPWDGTVDLVLRGLPAVVQTSSGVVRT